MVKHLHLLLISLALTLGTAFAQQPDTQPQPNNPPDTAYPADTQETAPRADAETYDNTPVYRVNVVARTTKAVNYRHHSGKTRVDFRGTDLMPEGSGHATVESRTGRMEIDADLDHLRAPSTFGPEYLTYVLWAITPEGRPMNLGEINKEEGKDSIKVTTDLQAFGLIVTAEPYFAVTRPSNLVVLENVVRENTKGWEEPIDTKFDALERGQYTIDIDPSRLPATAADSAAPIDLLEARNAVAIAQAEGADQYAPDSFQKAEDFLQRAEDYLQRREKDKVIATVARGAVQSAEDARILTIRKREEERAEADRRAIEQKAEDARKRAEDAEQREAAARAQADEEARRRDEAERERQQAEQAKAEADQARQQAEQARADAVAQQQAAQDQAQQAQMTAQQAQQAQMQTEEQARQTRDRLLNQLNQVLETKETARGLIIDMPDVLFDTGQATLKESARERLSKVAGILVVYPDLQVDVEGHTDNVGNADFNQKLSEDRAEAVKDFLVQQGVKPNSIQSQGMGMTQPVASNSTASGRQLNRRVDLVVSGESIGTTGEVQQQPPMN
jgi:outer membrane protein OmpA-like peptidoglycan-associated protein